MARAMLLLGGNIGDVAARIEGATALIESQIGTIQSRSTMLCTEAWGFHKEQPRFTNQAVEVTTKLNPTELLNATQRIEVMMGRERDEELRERDERGERYASRMIDIDIILYDELMIKSERLTIPHPLMQQREFVLRPIVEIAPEWRHAALGCSCRELLERL